MIRKLYRKFLVFWRLDLQIVCEESAKLGYCDYHDYTDTKYKYPWHFTELICERCGKRFYI